MSNNCPYIFFVQKRVIVQQPVRWALALMEVNAFARKDTKAQNATNANPDTFYTEKNVPVSQYVVS